MIDMVRLKTVGPVWVELILISFIDILVTLISETFSGNSRIKKNMAKTFLWEMLIHSNASNFLLPTSEITDKQIARKWILQIENFKGHIWPVSLYSNTWRQTHATNSLLYNLYDRWISKLQ